MEFDVLGMRIHVRREIVFAAGIFLAVLLGLTGYMISKRARGIVLDAAGSGGLMTGMGEQNSYGRTTGTGDRDSAGQSNEEGGEEGLPGERNTASGGNGAVAGGSSPDASVSAKAEEGEIMVYVVGCVMNPGIVVLKKGQLIDDAIKAAGGATKDADLENINLVYRLRDNVMLNIYPVGRAAPPVQGNDAGKGIRIVNDSGGAVVNDSGGGATDDSRIDINSAGISELDTLPGIGEATARDIIAYREKNGPFKSIRDIMKVPRIKENRFNTIKDYITVD